jgi:hypothetical protein
MSEKITDISDIIKTLNDFQEWTLTQQDAMFDDRLIPNYIGYIKQKKHQLERHW